MRMARTLPMSSVTVGHSCSCERWFRMEAGIGQGSEACGGGGRVGRGRGAGTLADTGQAVAQTRGRGGIELGQRVTDDPRPMAVVAGDGEVGLTLEGGQRGGAIELGQRAIR